MFNTYSEQLSITERYDNVDIRVLKYFLSVVNEQNVTKAAKALHISQPALSRQLQNLEDELGTKLFERGNRYIHLTEEGTYLANRAKEITTLFDKTEANFHKDKIISGEIYIGCGETESMLLIVKAIKQLTTAYPDVKINLYSGNADDLTEKLDKGILDFGLVIEPTNKQKYNFLNLPTKDKWGILVTAKSQLAEKSNIQPADLENVPLIISQQTLVDNQLSSWLGKNLSTYNIVATYNLLYNASLLVKENIGVALCLDKIINTTDTDLKFIPLSPSLESSLNFIWKKDSVLSNASNKLLEFLSNQD